MTKKWKKILGGKYEVNVLGQIRFLGGIVKCKNRRNFYKKPFLLKQSTSTNGYKRVTLCKRKQYMVHRLILKAFGGNKQKYVDHINGNPSDNRLVNLRWCSHMENMANQKKKKASKNPYKGVSFRKDRNKWRAYIVKNYKQISLGMFDTAEQARDAYNKGALKYHKNFAKLN